MQVVVLLSPIVEQDGDSVKGPMKYRSIVDADGAYLIRAETGRYQVSLGLQWGGGHFVRSEKELEIIEEGVTVQNFHLEGGHSVSGSFQFELQPEKSTFVLEVFRERTMELIGETMLVPGEDAHAPIPGHADGEESLGPHQGRHGDFLIPGLPPDLYLLRFRLPPDRLGKPSAYSWDYPVDLRFGDVDFGKQFADFGE